MNRAKFFDQFDDEDRLWAAEQFHAAIHAGATGTEDVVFKVLGIADQQYRSDRRWNRMRDAIECAPFEAMAFAANARWWHTLPTELKVQRKPKELQTERPATDAQMNTLRDLGYCGVVDSKQHATQLIMALKAVRQ